MIVRKTVAALALAAPMVLGGPAFADEPVPDPTGTCQYDVDATTTSGSETCSTNQDVAGAAQVDGSSSGSGSVPAGGCASGDGTATAAGTPVSTGPQGGCTP